MDREELKRPQMYSLADAAPIKKWYVVTARVTLSFA